VCLAVVGALQTLFIRRLIREIDDLKKEIKIRKEIHDSDQDTKYSLNELALGAYKLLEPIPGMKEIANHGIIFHTNKQKDYAPNKK
jgi:hypothetical protein